MLRTNCTTTATLKAKIQDASWGRALHILDVENLAGTGRLTAELVSATARLYRAAVPMGPRDLIACAADINNQFALQHGWPSIRYLWGIGPDGADVTAVEELEIELHRGRFDHFLIGSGDHAFASISARLAGAGHGTTCVYGRGAISRQMRLASQTVIHLPLTNEDLRVA